MIDAAAVQLIRQQIVRDGRSLLQYTGEAVPYAPPEAQVLCRRLEAVAAEETAAVARLVRFLQRHHATPPVLGSFPTSFTAINFTSLAHLLPALIHDQERSIAALELGLAAVSDSDARHLLADYLGLKRAHLRALQGIARGDAKAEAHHPSVMVGAAPAPDH